MMPKRISGTSFSTSPRITASNFVKHTLIASIVLLAVGIAGNINSIRDEQKATAVQTTSEVVDEVAPAAESAMPVPDAAAPAAEAPATDAMAPADTVAPVDYSTAVVSEKLTKADIKKTEKAINP